MIFIGPSLKPVKVPSGCIPSVLCVNSTTQLGLIYKNAEGALNATVHFMDKMLKSTNSNISP